MVLKRDITFTCDLIYVKKDDVLIMVDNEDNCAFATSTVVLLDGGILSCNEQKCVFFFL